jgi:hypothetical protein
MLEEEIIDSVNDIDINKNDNDIDFDIVIENKSKIETDAFLNQASLDYLINKKQYKFHLTNEKNKKIHRKDKKFYRKRILNLSKDLLYKEEDEIIASHDIKSSFDNYVKTCVHYFKMLDRNDIIQKDYTNFEEEIKEEKELSETDKFLKEENEKLLMRKIKISSNKLDNFIKIKMTKQAEDLIIPQQKEINLKDPILKNKGVNKKKNIINNYDEDTKNESNEIKKIEK